MEDSFDLLSEGNEILDGVSLPRKDHVEFVVKVFIGFIFALVDFLEKIEHEEFPELR